MTITPEPTGRRLLVLDSSYCYESILQRELQASVTCRDLGGFFDRVWSVHPLAPLVTSPGWGRRLGGPTTYPIDNRHTFVEGTLGRFRWLDFAGPLNLLLAQIGLLMWLARLVRRERISVIRAGDPLYLGLFGLILARMTGRPLLVRVGANNDKIFESTGLPMMPRLLRYRWLEKRIERFVLPRADVVAGANRDNLGFALSNGARRERATLFRYGNLIHASHLVPPAERPDARPLLEKAGLVTGKFLLYVGRLEPVKHPDHVIEVLARIRAMGYDVKAALVGDGRMRDRLLDLAEELGVRDYVILYGNRDQVWLSAVIPHAAAVVSPHTGRALTEVAFAGVPVAAYDIDWQGELIDHGVTGALVPYADVSALADGVAALIGNPAHGRACGERLREKVAVMMDPGRLDQHERDVYRRLFGGQTIPDGEGAP